MLFQKVHRLRKPDAFHDAHEIDHVAFDIGTNPAFEDPPLGPQRDRRRAIAFRVPFRTRAAKAIVIHFQSQITGHLQNRMPKF